MTKFEEILTESLKDIEDALNKLREAIVELGKEVFEIKERLE